MKNRKLQNSVKSLINLYTVVIGVALSIAVVGAIDVNTGLASLSSARICLFLSFVVTLFPFFHGALRHLDDAFIENVNPHIATSALIIDFTLLFLHALAFVILSQLLQHPAQFAWILIAVLTIDVIWGGFVYYGASSKTEKLSPEAKWTIINFLFIVFAAMYLIGNDVYLDYRGDERKLSLLMLFACALRSGVDYFWCREFYFPKSEQ